MRNRDKKLPGWLSFIFSVWEWFVVGFLTIIFAMIGSIIVSPFAFLLDRIKRNLLHRVSVYWAHSLIFTNPIWHLKVIGRENVDPKKNYVIVANHQSMLDILVLLSGLPVDFKFLAKKELFPIPFLGWHMALAGYIPIDRGNKDSGQQAIKSARRWLQSGVSVVFFPEGTRSLDGYIQRFKPGAIKIARDEAIEILPIVIDGTSSAIPKKSWKIQKKTQFVLWIGKPIRVTGKNQKSIEEIKEDLRNQMVRQLEKIRGREQ
ncbi:MAG: 1-acyl-sn-glycerol-3-phosphate acyltransferase [Candidatus Omnitrophica bacterium]|nr:1-acyl-sn-glycerol-3-phosphate acyltransferase [Candidatus Omnitrophota bacterium]